MTDRFQEGKAALLRRDYASALRAFGVACTQDKGNATYQAYRAWAKYLALRVSVTHDDGGEEWLRGVAAKNCKAIIQRATKRVADFDAGYVFLGRILLDEADAEAAAAALREALRIDPTNEDAARYLEIARSNGSKPSFVKRLSNWFGGGSKEPERIEPVRVSQVRRPTL